MWENPRAGNNPTGRLIDSRSCVVEPLPPAGGSRPVGGRPRTDSAGSSESRNLCAELGQLLPACSSVFAISSPPLLLTHGPLLQVQPGWVNDFVLRPPDGASTDPPGAWESPSLHQGVHSRPRKSRPLQHLGPTQKACRHRVVSLSSQNCAQGKRTEAVPARPLYQGLEVARSLFREGTRGEGDNLRTHRRSSWTSWRPRAAATCRRDVYGATAPARGRNRARINLDGPPGSRQDCRTGCPATSSRSCPHSRRAAHRACGTSSSIS